MQSIFIKETERRGQPPKTYVIYKITVTGGVRSWNVWHRYSEFASLHDDLIQHTGSEPPAALPSKHRLSLLTSIGVSSDDSIVEERRTGLETYLRSILSAKESKWRDSFVFKDFLSIPVGRSGTGSASVGDSSGQFTSSAWLDEHSDLQTLVRDARADINTRDSLSSSSSPDIAGSHNANVQAKKKLAAVLARLQPLTKGLQDLALAGMREGEVQRRGDMVARLQDECNSLGKMVVAACQPTASSRAASGAGSGSGGAMASDTDRAALLGAGPVKGSSRPVTRVFRQKAPPQETDQTRPLDDTGLVQLQQVQMDQQDQQLTQLSTLLQRQKQLGLAISAEIEQQNEMLDQLASDIDGTSAKLGAANKQMRRLK